MRYSSIKAAILIAAGILGLCLYFAACDGPVEPRPLKDYSVYFCDFRHNEGNWYFAYHPTTNQLDSFWLPYASAPVISADGKKMYVSDRDHTMIAVVDLDSLVVIEQLPYKTAIAVSPDNQLIAVSGNGLYILRTSDYSEVFNDTDVVVRGVFFSNSQSFYGAVVNNVYKVDLSDTLFPVTGKSFSDGLVKVVIPSLDETEWFLYLRFATDGYLFAVYDISSDSIIFRDYLYPGHGELEMTPDGRYVFYTNPGIENSFPDPPFWFKVYDVEKNQIHKVINTTGILDEPYEVGVPVSEVCITPDGRWLVAAMSGEFSGYDFLLTLDISAMKIVKHRRLGGSRNFHGLACQNAP